MTKIVASVTGSISYSQKGEKGDNAVVYRLDATPSYISLDADGDINRNNEYSAKEYMLVKGYRIDGSERQNQWKSDKGLVTVQLSFNDGAVWTEYTTDPYLEQPRVDFDPQYLDSYGSISDEFSNTGLLNARVVMYVGSAVDPKDLTDDIILARMEIPVVQDGANGGKGPVIRQHRGFESGSYSYYSGKGHYEEFLDVVYVGKKWYRCTSTYATSSPSVTDGHWEVFSNFTSIATDILLAENASIDMLTGNEVNLYNPSDNTLYGSFRVVDNNDGYSLWVGGKTGSNANFAVTRGGSLRASDANITGTITATSGSIGGFDIGSSYIGTSPKDGYMGQEGKMYLSNNCLIFGATNRNVVVGPKDILGSYILADFSDNSNEPASVYGVCISVQNTSESILAKSCALSIGGGYVSGLRLHPVVYSSGGSDRRNPVCIPKGVNVVIINGSGYYQLPDMCPWDDGYVMFVKRTLSGESVSNVHLRAGYRVSTDGKTQLKGNYIYINREDVVTEMSIESRGDAFVLVYCKDLQANSGTQQGGWMQFKNPRDW